MKNVKNISQPVDKSLQEVWEIKERVSKELDAKPPTERVNLLRKSTEDICKKYGLSLPIVSEPELLKKAA